MAEIPPRAIERQHHGELRTITRRIGHGALRPMDNGAARHIGKTERLGRMVLRRGNEPRLSKAFLRDGEPQIARTN